MICGCAHKYKGFASLIDQESKKQAHQKLQLLLQQPPTTLESIIFQTEADYIFHNGTIYTMENQLQTVESIAISKDRIIALGKEKHVFTRKGHKTKIIDLNGKTMLPGFIDSHIHLCMLGFSHWIQLSSYKFKNKEQVLDKIIDEVLNAEQGSWVTFQLYDPTIIPGEIDVSKRGLDEITTTKAIYILQANGHVGHVNSFAFEKAGVTKQSPDPPYGRFMRDQNGQLTGQLQQTALHEIIKYVPSITLEDYMQNCKMFIKHVTTKGCTTLHDCGIGALNVDIELSTIYQLFRKNGKTSPIRFSGFLVSNLWSKWMDMNMKPEFKDPQLRINGIKCWIDGSTQAGSAFLYKPYLKQQWGVGHANYMQEQLNRVAFLAQQKGFQVGIHANGDAGINMALNALQYAQKKNNNNFKLRHRIQHSTVCQKESLKRMKQLSVNPSFLIGHIYYYGRIFRDMVLGPERASMIDPVKSALDNGLTPTLHSDYNCQPVDPLRCIHNAVTRIMRDNGQVLNHEQRISAYEGVKTMTINAAWQCHMEDIIGSLKRGKMADFVILQKDPMLCKPQEIINIEVKQTWKGGKIQFMKL